MTLTVVLSDLESIVNPPDSDVPAFDEYSDINELVEYMRKRGGTWVIQFVKRSKFSDEDAFNLEQMFGSFPDICLMAIGGQKKEASE